MGRMPMPPSKENKIMWEAHSGATTLGLKADSADPVHLRERRAAYKAAAKRQLRSPCTSMSLN